MANSSNSMIVPLFLRVTGGLRALVTKMSYRAS